MGRDRDRGGLERLLGEREQDLMRAAVALTGSRADGEDLAEQKIEPNRRAPRVYGSRAT